MNAKNIIVLALVASATMTSTAFAAVGDYKEIACDAAYFSANSCKACFEGKAIAVGEAVNGLYDGWTNKNASEQLIYKDEQTMPSMVPTSPATTFVANPSDPALFWKFGKEIIWTDSTTGTGRQEFMLSAGKTVRFLEGDLGASYTLSATDKKAGETVGVLVIPINYHNVDVDGNEGKREVHTECVAYTSKAAIARVVPVETVKPAQLPPKMTTVKTGPQEMILVALALLIAAGFIVARNRKTV